MDVVVTGGAGFIGSNLVRSLLAGGARVTVIDNLVTGSLDNLDDVSRDVQAILGDVRDRSLLDLVMPGKDAVFHLAALGSVTRSLTEPVAVHETNATGTLNVLLSARDHDVERVVYASSSSVYGNTPTLPKHEEMPESPLSPYAASKLAGESYCRSFSRVFGLKAVALRFFNVFGPRQDPDSEYAAVIPRFIDRMMCGQSPVIFGTGDQSRDFTPVANAVQACLLAGAADAQAAGETFNIGCGGRISLLRLLEALNRILGTDLPPIFTDPRAGDVLHSEAAIGKAESVLGYMPLTSVEGGLVQTMEWMGRRMRDRSRPNVALHRLRVAS